VLDHAILRQRPDLGGRPGRPAVLRVEFLLQVVEQAFACIEYVLRVLLVFDPGRVSGAKSFSRNFSPS